MKLPRGNAPVRGCRRSLDVMGKTYAVHFRRTAPMMDGQPVRGWTDPQAQTIAISGVIAREQQRSTLLHEVGHAILDAHGAHPRDEERCVLAYEAGTYQVLRAKANRWFVAFLTEA